MSPTRQVLNRQTNIRFLALWVALILAGLVWDNHTPVVEWAVDQQTEE